LPEVEKRRRRRALDESECARLLPAAFDGPRRRFTRRYRTKEQTRFTLKTQANLAYEGRKIALAYRLMLSTGLRLNELRTLTWADVDLDAGALTVRAVNAKNRHDATLPLPPDALDALKAWRKTNVNAAGTALLTPLTGSPEKVRRKK
jgi:integrase